MSTLSNQDWKLLYGCGLFETIRVYHGTTFLLAEHIDRLRSSARALGLTNVPSRGQLIATVENFIEVSGVSDEVVRLTLTFGDPDTGTEHGLLMSRRPLPVGPTQPDRDIDLMLATVPRNEQSLLVHHKTTNQMEGILCRREALERGCYDSLFFNTQGSLAEGTRCNVFIVRNGQVITPETNSGILAGITRQAVINLLTQRGVVVCEGRITRDELLTCDECFITNSVVEVMPVKTIDCKPLPKPIPGAITMLAANLYANEVRRLEPFACAELREVLA